MSAAFARFIDTTEGNPFLDDMVRTALPSRPSLIALTLRRAARFDEGG